MKAAVPPANEARRLAELRGYEILDTPPDAGLDALTEVIALQQGPEQDARAARISARRLVA